VKKHLIVLIVLVFSLGGLVEAQTLGDNPSFKDRLFTGGSFGAAFGAYTYVSVSPVMGYMISPRLSAGVGALYRYVRDDRFVPTYESNDWGLNVFSRFVIYQPLFAHMEYEYLNIDYGGEREGFNNVFLGGGAAFPLGRNAAFLMMALYNFSYDETAVRQPYGSPWVFRVGITAGF
jgi:hypothetical protein